VVVGAAVPPPNGDEKAPPSPKHPEEESERHPLVGWFESEVRSELESINRKLDQLIATSSRLSGGSALSVGGASRSKTKNRVVLKSDTKMCLARCDSAASELDGAGSHTASGNEQPARARARGLSVILSKGPSPRRLPRQATLSQIVPEGDAESTNDSNQVCWPSEEEDRHNRRSGTTVSCGSRPGASRPESGRMDPRHASLSPADAKLLQQATLLHKQHTRPEIAESIWAFLEDADSGRWARRFACLQQLFIMATVCVTLLQTPVPSPLSGLTAAVLEICCDAIFLLEFLVRSATCPSAKAFFFSFYAVIDFLAAAPLALRLAVGPVLPEGPPETAANCVLMFAVPIVRLLKTLRRFQNFHLLLKAFHLAAEALPVLIFILFTIAFVFSVLIYLAERPSITSLPKAFWLTLVTMTTVGYGDIYPTTDAGICITGVLIIITVLYMAIPLGIVGEAFAKTWQDRDRILLMQRTRERLCQWGYTASDIPVLFRLSDSNDDGDLSLHEFRQLLTRMHIGFSDERIMKLFSSLDSSQTGTIDARDFVRGLFPSAYHEIFDEEDMAVSEAPSGSARPSARADEDCAHSLKGTSREDVTQSLPGVVRE